MQQEQDEWGCARALVTLRRSLSGTALEEAHRQIAEWRNRGIYIRRRGGAGYPEELNFLDDPPALLFVQSSNGGLPPPPRVAVVGARNADTRGCQIARGLSRALAGSGVCVVSGLAIGIDGAAHLGALEGGAEQSTIAVLGSGLENVYPRRHQALAREIVARGGAVVSHFEPAIAPHPLHFLDRNRLIAAFASVIVVVQAARRSGALATARYALELGREVVAVPGGWGDPLHEGTNELIKQGAYMVTSPEDVLELLPAYENRRQPTTP